MPQYRQATHRFLATVLFTDIVGSTEHAARVGDRAWRDLLEKHNAIVRRELRAFQGREMDTAGDGFFAVFEAPERAVRCAESIIAAVAAVGLGVRAGVHTGECEVVGGKVAGMAVVIGARIAALAGPGEVLVSGSVRDLMTGSGQHFEGGGARELKGVEDPWRVYRLVPDEVNGEGVASRRPSVVPLYTRRQRRRLLVTGASVLVLVLALSAAYVLTRSAAEVVVGENAVGVIGGGNSTRVSDTVTVGQRPTAVAGDRDVVWVTNSTSNSISRIDRRTGVSVQIPVGASPSGVAVGAGAVWVANSGDSTVSRIDRETSRPTVIPVRAGPTGVVAAFGSVWVTLALDASIAEIDPATNKVVKVVSVGANPTGIAAGAGYLWVTNQGDGTVTRVDPETYERDPAVPVGSGPAGIAFGAGAAWVANNLDGSLSRIDADDLSVNTHTLARKGGAYGVATSDGDVWVSNEYAGTLMRVTSSRDFRLAATVSSLRGAPLGLAFVGDDLWFTSANGDTAVHRGGVLRMVGPGVGYPFGDDPPVLDPTLQYDPANWRLAALTNDGLVGVRRAGGVRGAELVPDLATTVPKPTEGGLTYTFHLRPGVRYSTGAPVLAGDIRRGIERSLVHNSGAGYAYYAPAIVGGPACKKAADKATAAGRPLPACDLSRGITTNDRTGTVTFHLRRPTPEFTYQLALPSGSAVPQATPLDLAPGTFLPATGPYRVLSYTPKGKAPDRHGRLELVRNRFFHQWSAAAQPEGYPDRIVLDTGYTDTQSIARVAAGLADVVWLGVAKRDIDTLRTRYPAQVHPSAGLFVRYLFLNATKPPFDNLDARRAVAFALDRGALAEVFAGEVTCQLLPPDFPGHLEYCPFTVGMPDRGRWSGQDLAQAEDLVRRSGTRGARVVVVLADDPDPAWLAGARTVVAALNGLGYRASVQVQDPSTFYDITVADPDHDFNAGLTMWGADYPAASNYLVTLGACDRDVGFFNHSWLCVPGLDERLAEAYQLQTTDPARANNSWAAADRALVNAAATIPFSADLTQDFVSRRVGNVLIRPGYGPLVGQMWVQ